MISKAFKHILLQGRKNGSIYNIFWSNEVAVATQSLVANQIMPYLGFFLQCWLIGFIVQV